MQIILFHQAGVTLIQVPYWWDFTEQSLAETIRNAGISV